MERVYFIKILLYCENICIYVWSYVRFRRDSVHTYPSTEHCLQQIFLKILLYCENICIYIRSYVSFRRESVRTYPSTEYCFILKVFAFMSDHMYVSDVNRLICIPPQSGEARRIECRVREPCLMKHIIKFPVIRTHRSVKSDWHSVMRYPHISSSRSLARLTSDWSVQSDARWCGFRCSGCVICAACLRSVVQAIIRPIKAWLLLKVTKNISCFSLAVWLI